MNKKRIKHIVIFYLLFIFSFPLFADSRTISGENYIGCQSREYRDKLTKYAVDKDIEAFKKAVAVGVNYGECTVFDSGEKVFEMDTAAFSGMVKVRREGGTKEFWTNIEAIK